MSFLPVVLASLVGRGGRFFLVAMLIAAGGEKLESKLRQFLDIIGWVIVALVVIGGVAYKYLH
jgi:membrane protein DedA with SNARE-associated domain